MKIWLKIVCGLALSIGLLSLVGAGAARAHTFQHFAPLATCKQMHQVAVVVATGDKFQRICVPEGQERSLSQVRAICNYSEVAVFFEDQTLQKRFDIAPEQCQLFDLDDGNLFT
ncbi:hypothetical protein EPA93_16660 [Ktedonosporobacter rubrisoli]|uniref:Uncharacterized protein n=1 Tax=Ktedonosporobacter rubrisoli TaxID=2509675 RepID=A0A4P6JQJ5_KTERU|nr:hypothetical protein [Ktedonosporobacter rubrisoli]QBD77533.1 hypothetical protein EPA93_16660 [Ktedonosporobacter rubrisoli]